MAQNFNYRARNNKGKIIKGSIVAESAGAATAMLRDRKLFVLTLKPGRARNARIKPLETKVGASDLALFCRQFATMIECGVPIVQCLNILTLQTDNKKLVEAIKGMVEMLQKGRSLSEAAGAYPGAFPRIFNSMLEAGEVSGSLGQVMEKLALHFEKEHDLREKVKSAMTYPAVVAVVAVIAVAALMAFVVPAFVKMLTEYNAELPLATAMVIGVSKVISGYWFIIIAALGAFSFACKSFAATARGRVVLDRLAIRVPVFGSLARRMILSRFAGTMGMLLACGVPLLQAFDVVKKVVGNSVVEQAISEAADCVKEGQGIAGPLQKSGVFPPMVTRVISIGEETGSLASMLEKLSGYYDREVEETVTRLSSVLEPVLIVVVGGLVGLIMLSIMMPMFSIMGSID